MARRGRAAPGRRKAKPAEDRLPKKGAPAGRRWVALRVSKLACAYDHRVTGQLRQIGQIRSMFESAFQVYCRVQIWIDLFACASCCTLSFPTLL